MGTVKYKHQPAIDATRGAVPLAGNSYVYTVSKLLWPKDVENFIASQIVGTSLHICCGKSLLGDVRLDLYEPTTNVVGDAARLPFRDCGFDTLIIDPPYNGKFQWNHDMLSELGRVSNKRFIFQHWFVPVDKLGYFKKEHAFVMTGLYGWMPKTYFGRMQMISVFDRVTDDGY